MVKRFCKKRLIIIVLLGCLYNDSFARQQYQLIECEGVIISEFHSTSNNDISYRLRVRLDNCNSSIPSYITLLASFSKDSFSGNLVKQMIKRHQKGLFKFYKKGFSYRLIDILGFN